MQTAVGKKKIGSRSRHGGLKGSKPRGRLRRMGWGGGTGRRCRRTLRGLRSGQGLWEPFKGLWDGKCTGLIHRCVHGRRESQRSVDLEGKYPIRVHLKGERLP